VLGLATGLLEDVCELARDERVVLVAEIGHHQQQYIPHIGASAPYVFAINVLFQLYYKSSLRM
jgi:hypothetical protein